MKKRKAIVPDPNVNQILEAFQKYQMEHQQACITVHRRNDVIFRIRIIDPDFEGQDDEERDNLIWKVFDHLPPEVIQCIYILLLFTPKEAKKSWVNMEFEETMAKGKGKELVQTLP